MANLVIEMPDELARGLAPILAFFFIRQPIRHHAAVGVRRRISHVNEVEVKRFARWFAIFGRPVAEGFFVNLECCDHVFITFCFPSSFGC